MYTCIIYIIYHNINRLDRFRTHSTASGALPGLIARLGNRYVSLDVEEHADLLSTGADILAQIDSSLLALAFPLVRSPHANTK